MKWRRKDMRVGTATVVIEEGRRDKLEQVVAALPPRLNAELRSESPGKNNQNGLSIYFSRKKLQVEENDMRRYVKEALAKVGTNAAWAFSNLDLSTIPGTSVYYPDDAEARLYMKSVGKKRLTKEERDSV